MMQKTVKELKKGEFFTLKEIEEPNEMQVYIRGDYIPGEKVYGCQKFGDMNYERFLKSTRKVFVGFTF